MLNMNVKDKFFESLLVEKEGEENMTPQLCARRRQFGDLILHSRPPREPLEETKENWFKPWKWSSPLNPIPNTKRKVVAGADPQSHEGYKCKKTKPNYHEKPSVRNQIQGILANLEAECPFFLKCMIHSDVVKNKSSLTLPKQFCQAHLPIHDTTITLEHECGKEYEVKFLAKYRRLSGGWRSFCNESKLLKGDLLVFQWVRPLMKFKVYKVEANTLFEVDASFILLKLSLSTATHFGNIQNTSLILDANLEDDQSEGDNDQELSSKSISNPGPVADVEVVRSN